MKWRISLIITHEWAPSLSPPSPFRDISSNNARDRKGKHPLPPSFPGLKKLHSISRAPLVYFSLDPARCSERRRCLQFKCLELKENKTINLSHKSILNKQAACTNRKPSSSDFFLGGGEVNG